MIHRMQEICYDQAPVIPFGYSKDLDVHNAADWEGWVQMPAGNGSVANMWNYLSVQPEGGEQWCRLKKARTRGSSSASSSRRARSASSPRC